MEDGPQPDFAEKGIRFGCGFLAGSIIGFFFFLSGAVAFSGRFWMGVIGGALIFGFLAMRYGDSAWHGLVRFLSSLWPW